MNDTEKTITAEEPKAERHNEDLVLLDPCEAQFRTEGIRVQMKQDDEWCEVALARLFPLSEPEAWISVVGKEDKEIGVFKTLHGMPHASLSCVRAELHRRYLVPEIRRIIAVKNRFHLVEWTVETNRGEMAFLTNMPHEQIKPELLPRVMLADVEGNRFDIPDINALDPESRTMLEQRM